MSCLPETFGTHTVKVEQEVVARLAGKTEGDGVGFECFVAQTEYAVERGKVAVSMYHIVQQGFGGGGETAVGVAGKGVGSEGRGCGGGGLLAPQLCVVVYRPLDVAHRLLIPPCQLVEVAHAGVQAPFILVHSSAFTGCHCTLLQADGGVCRGAAEDGGPCHHVIDGYGACVVRHDGHRRQCLRHAVRYGCVIRHHVELCA